MRKILVTGAAGRVGRHVVRRLVGENVALRLLLRSPPAQTDGASGEVVVGDYNDAAQMAKACNRVDAVFMYAPNTQASSAVFRALREAGVRQVVLLSSASVSKAPPGANPIAERHRAAETAAQAAQLDWTFIRPDTMASNCLQWAASIRDEGRVYTPYPESMRNPLHEDDIALLAVASLLSGEHSGRAFDVTGSALLRVSDQVDAIATELGRTLECVRISHAQALARMAATSPGLSDQAAARLLDYLQKSVTVAPRITDDFARATGHAPRTFSEWARDNIDQFTSARDEGGRRRFESPFSEPWLNRGRHG